MARARLIKPGFFANEDLSELHPFGRLLFIGLWTIADKEGRLPDRPKWIKGALFPYENVTVEKLLGDLSGLQFIERYEVDGERYIQIVNFKKHQSPHRNEAPSTIPAPEEHASAPSKLGTAPAVPIAVAVPIAEAVAVAPDSASPPVLDDIDQVASDFAQYGKVTSGTPKAIEWSVKDYGIEWVGLAVRKGAGADFEKPPNWAYIEAILERWQAQGGPDEPRPSNGIHTPEPADSGLSAEHERLGLGKPPVYVARNPYRDYGSVDVAGAGNG